MDMTNEKVLRLLEEKLRGGFVPNIPVHHTHFVDPRTLDWSHNDYFRDKERYMFVKRIERAKDKVERTSKECVEYWRVSRLYYLGNRLCRRLLNFCFDSIDPHSNKKVPHRIDRWIMYEYCFVDIQFQEWSLCCVIDKDAPSTSSHRGHGKRTSTSTTDQQQQQLQRDIVEMAPHQGKRQCTTTRRSGTLEIAHQDQHQQVMSQHSEDQHQQVVSQFSEDQQHQQVVSQCSEDQHQVLSEDDLFAQQLEQSLTSSEDDQLVSHCSQDQQLVSEAAQQFERLQTSQDEQVDSQTSDRQTAFEEEQLPSSPQYYDYAQQFQPQQQEPVLNNEQESLVLNERPFEMNETPFVMNERPFVINSAIPFFEDDDAFLRLSWEPC